MVTHVIIILLASENNGLLCYYCWGNQCLWFLVYGVESS